MTNIDDAATTIGKIIINFNALELTLRRLVWFLVDRNNPSIGKATTKELQPDGVIKLGFRLLKVSTLEEHTSASIKEALSHISSIRIERNEVAHSYFMIKNDATNLSQVFTAWPQHYKKGEFFSDNEPLDEEKLKELNARCINAMDSISSLLVEIGAGVDFGNT